MNPRPLACLALLTALLLPIPAEALAVKKLWSVRHSTFAEYYSQSAQSMGTAIDSAGNVIVTGFDLNQTGGIYHFTAKYSAAEGELLWETRHYDHFGPFAHPNSKVAVDSRGDVIVHLEFRVGNQYANYTAKYATADGGRLWERKNGGVAYTTSGLSNLAVDPAGNAVVCGLHIGGGFEFINHLPAHVRKYASKDGATIWDHFDYRGYGVVTLDRAGNAIIAGYKSTSKYAAATGRVLWTSHFQPNLNLIGPFLSGVGVDQAGNAAVTGYFRIVGDDFGAPLREVTVKFSPDGTRLWQNHFRTHSDYAILVMDSIGNVIISGSSLNTVIAKFASTNGATVWTKRIIGGIRSGYFRAPPALAVDSADHVALVCTYRQAGRFAEILTTKFAANGDTIWRQRYDSAGDVEDAASGVSVSPGCVIASGISSKIGFGRTGDAMDIILIKYVDGATTQTLPADPVSTTVATLHGTINPNTFPANATFEYGTDPNLANAIAVPLGAIGKGTDPVAVETTITGLNPVTTYYYRTVATANSQAIRGAIRQFTTPLRWDFAPGSPHSK